MGTRRNDERARATGRDRICVSFGWSGIELVGENRGVVIAALLFIALLASIPLLR